MAKHPRAGQLALPEQLINVARLIADYYLLRPDVADPSQQVSFGTSGHRGSALKRNFNQAHLLAIAQAICDHRKLHQVKGPVFIGVDTHALSEPAFGSVIQVLVANGVNVVVQQQRGYTPTPVISHAIVCHNRQHPQSLSDGIVITPSHNPPQDGGLKYNDTHGGPADTAVTGWVQRRANELLHHHLAEVKQLDFALAMDTVNVSQRDFAIDYIDDLENVVDMAAISKAKVKIAVDPLGGSGLAYWALIAKRYQLDIEVTNEQLDARFAFVPLDKDGVIRMDCSSAYCMTELVKRRDEFDIGIGNDPDFDRHGIVTKEGLMNANQYLVTVVYYLLNHRPQWPTQAKVGRSLMATSMIDRIARHLGREVFEVPVGFKWFVQSLHQKEIAIAAEDSAGASFLRRDGTVWGCDKDGFILGLLAAEMLAVTGLTPCQLYQQLTEQFGTPIYKRLDAPASEQLVAAFKSLDESSISTATLAGEPILAVYTKAPGNGRGIGGLKVVTENGWFAARPSGTEPLYKIYLESFKDQAHLAQLEQEAQALVDGLGV